MNPTLPEPFNPLWIIIAVLFLAVIALGIAFAVKLKRGGTENKAIPGQVALRGLDLLDSLEERVIEALKKHAAALPSPSMKDNYFDNDSFIEDIGRLKPDFTKTITLDGKVKREGAGETVEYWTQQPSGNVSRTKPQTSGQSGGIAATLN